MKVTSFMKIKYPGTGEHRFYRTPPEKLLPHTIHFLKGQKRTIAQQCSVLKCFETFRGTHSKTTLR